VVWGDTDDGPVLLVQGDIVCFEVARSHAVEVPKFREAGEEGARDSAEREGAEGCVEGGEDCNQDEDGDEDEMHFVDINDEDCVSELMSVYRIYYYQS
jgi:hypothetical protein